MKLTDLRARFSELIPAELMVSTCRFLRGEKRHWVASDGSTGCGIVQTGKAQEVLPPRSVDCWPCLGALRGSGIWDFWKSEANPYKDRMTDAEVLNRFEGKHK